MDGHWVMEFKCRGTGVSASGEPQVEQRSNDEERLGLLVEKHLFFKPELR